MIFPSKRMVPYIVSLALFMEALDTMIINTAIPVMADSLKINPIDLKIALISYLLTLAIFIPISGWIADKYGNKRVFVTAIAIFTLGSLGCGFSQNLHQLVLTRIFQGLGGSLAIPVGRLIIVRTFNRKELLITMSHVAMIMSVGLMLGPVLGGIITHNFSWRWIFWVNVPMGIFNFCFALYYLPNIKSSKVPKLDFMGFVLFGSGLATLIFGLSALSETKIRLLNAVIIMAIAIFLLIAYKKHSQTQRYPIIETKLLSIRTFRIAVLGNLFSRLGFGGTLFLVPLMLQIGLTYSSQTAGLLLAPTAVGVFASRPFTLRLLNFFGYKYLLILNTFFAGLSLWSFIFVTAETSIVVIALLTLIFGFISSLQYSGMNSLAYADIHEDSLRFATSIMSTLQQVATSFGVAASAIVIHFYAYYFYGHFELSTRIFHYTFFTMGIITMLSAYIYKNLRHNDGEAMIHA